MKIRFEVPVIRIQRDAEMDAVPREGETVYLTVRGHRRLFQVKRVAWFPEEPDQDFDAYVVLHRGQ